MGHGIGMEWYGRRIDRDMVIGRAELGLPRRIRWGVVALVVVLHLLAIAALVRAFTPEIAENIVGSITTAFDIPLDPPRPALPKPEPTRKPATPREEGDAGAPGRKASPRETAVPKAPIAVKPTEAPPVAGTGHENAAGATDKGEGTGASGQGTGLGAGAGGTGTGGGASKAVKIAGDISSARDYPRASRELRLGHQVVVVMRVGTDGRVKSCRVSQPSPDAEADRITCRLATERFRFRPARDGAGNAVEADYGWRQRWFLTGQE